MKKKVLRILGICVAVGLMITFVNLPPLIHIDYANRTAEARLLLEDLHTALDAYLLDIGQYPETKEGLRVLIQWPKKLNWNGPYFKKTFDLNDPWGNPLIYQRLENGFELSTLGADGKIGGSGEAEDIMVKGTQP